MPNPSTYPYRRFPTIQVGAADHAARGTDAVKQELHALCAGSSKTVVTVECYPGTDQAEILVHFLKHTKKRPPGHLANECSTRHRWL